MSLTIKLQLNNSPSNYLDKVTVDVLTLTGTLKEGSSLQKPVVMVEHSGVISGVNYAYIEAFGRSYYITDIVNEHNNLWTISLKSDPLTSFKTQIRACNAIIAKNEKSFNLYLNDTNFKCYQNPYIITRLFPNGFSTSNFSYIMAMCCDKTQTAP